MEFIGYMEGSGGSGHVVDKWQTLCLRVTCLVCGRDVVGDGPFGSANADRFPIYIYIYINEIKLN